MWLASRGGKRSTTVAAGIGRAVVTAGAVSAKKFRVTVQEGVDRGRPVKKGDRIFYYPNTKTVLSGPEADKAGADFEANRFDEAQMTGGW